MLGSLDYFSLARQKLVGSLLQAETSFQLAIDLHLI